MAPFERRLERLLARRRGGAARTQQPKAVVQPLGNRVRSQRSQPGRCELDRQRHAVEPVADAHHVASVPVVEGEAGGRRPGPLDEEANRLVAEEVVAVDRSFRIRERERRHAEDRLALDSQRLAAGRDDRDPGGRAKQRIGDRRCGDEDVLAVVQHEQERPPGQELGHGGVQIPAGQRPHIERGGDRLHDVRRLGHGRELDEHRSIPERSLDPSCQLEREPGLACAAGSRECEEPCPGQERFELVELALPADERGRVERQAAYALDHAELPQLVGEGGRELGELVPAAFDPVLVAVLGEELTAVQRQRRPVRGGRSCTAGIDGCPLELLDVDGDAGGEVQQLVAELDRIGAQRAPGDVQSLVEVVRGRIRALLAPERVHRLLAVEAMLRGERQQLHQLARLPQSPGPVRDGLLVDHGAEASEQLDPRVRHPDTRMTDSSPPTVKRRQTARKECSPTVAATHRQGGLV